MSIISMWNKHKYNLVKENPYNKQELDGLGLAICSEWNDSFIKIISENNVMHLFLNYSLGWKCSDYSFLGKIRHLKTLEIIDIHSTGIKNVELQPDLTTLSLNMPDAANIDYQVFHNLKNVFCYGFKRNDTLFSCNSIENLYMDELKIGDKHGIGNLKNLKCLTIANSNITSLTFVRNLLRLKNLAIINCKKILSFSDISFLTNLTRLDIRGVKGLHDIGFLTNLHNIEIIVIETDKLTSIKPVANLPQIKALALFGKKCIIEDMDLTPIANLKQLSLLDIPNRKCYTAKINNYWDWNGYGTPRQNWLIPKTSMKKA